MRCRAMIGAARSAVSSAAAFTFRYGFVYPRLDSCGSPSYLPATAFGTR